MDYDDTAVNEAIVVVKDHINDFKKQLTDSRDIFDNSCWGFYGLFIVTTTLGLCAWAFGCGVLSMIMGLIGFLLFFLTWFLFIVFYTTGVIMVSDCHINLASVSASVLDVLRGLARAVCSLYSCSRLRCVLANSV